MSDNCPVSLGSARWRCGVLNKMPSTDSIYHVSDTIRIVSSQVMVYFSLFFLDG